MRTRAIDQVHYLPLRYSDFHWMSLIFTLLTTGYFPFLIKPSFDWTDLFNPLPVLSTDLWVPDDNMTSP